MIIKIFFNFIEIFSHLEAGLGDDPEGEVGEAAQTAAGLQVGEDPALHAVVAGPGQVSARLSAVVDLGGYLKSEQRGFITTSYRGALIARYWCWCFLQTVSTVVDPEN